MAGRRVFSLSSLVFPHLLNFRTMPLGKKSCPHVKNGHHFEGTGMNTKLNHIQNWHELARETKWSASALAKKCGVSVRTLHRYFLQHMGKNPKDWLAEQRQHNALKLLCNGSSIKETAACLGYKQPNNFTRHYKSRTGISPSRQSLANLTCPQMIDSVCK
jgi:AraC-like DNA-binding protein